MNSLTLLYSAKDDVVLTAMGHLPARVRSHINIVGMDELAPYLRPAEWPWIIDASFPDAVLNLFRGCNVINRPVVRLPPRLEMVASDCNCSVPWVHFVINRVLRNSHSLVYDVGAPGVSRSLLPLNTQWWYASSAPVDVDTPSFAFGFGRELPKLDGLTHPSRRTPWSFFDWTGNGDAQALVGDAHAFFVERPRGLPVVHYYLGEERGDIFLREQFLLDCASMVKIEEFAKSAFRSCAGEFLLFVDGSRVTFGAFSPFLETAARDNRFAYHFKRWVEGYVLA